MISVVEYYAEATKQLRGLTPPASVNADRSMIAMSPATSPAERARVQAELDPSLPYFTVDAEGHPTLVTPAPATLPPAPPLPVPTPIAPEPVTPSTSFTPAPTPSPEPLPGVGGCPPGMIPNPQAQTFVSTPGATQSVEQQVQSAFDQSGLVQTAQAFGCKCEPVLAAQQAVSASDFLVVSLYNTASCPTTVTVTARVMDCNCNIQTYQRSVSMTAYVRTGASAFGAPLTATICIPLTDGYLISVAVSMTATFVIEAAMWAVAEIRSNSCSGTSSATLFQDYLQFGKTLGWPGGRQLSVGEGPGTARWRNFTYTAGGGGFTDTWQVPGGSLGLCRQIYFGLTTNAAAGNRVVYVAYTPPEGGLMFFGGALSQPPSTSFGWVFAPNVTQGLFNGFIAQQTIPDNLWASGGGGINLFIDNDNAGDVMDRGGVAFQMWPGPFVAF